MRELNGTQVGHDWRTEELRHAGDDMRRQRESHSPHERHVEHDHTRRGMRGWVGRHLIGVGHSVAGDPRPLTPCPDGN